jgi:hypothetical protein
MKAFTDIFGGMRSVKEVQSSKLKAQKKSQVPSSNPGAQPSGPQWSATSRVKCRDGEAIAKLHRRGGRHLACRRGRHHAARILASTSQVLPETWRLFRRARRPPPRDFAIASGIWNLGFLLSFELWILSFFSACSPLLPKRARNLE